MTDAVRTPDELLEGLPDFPFESHYREVDGLRLAHLDEGDGAPVVFVHGEPTWSFLWRNVIGRCATRASAASPPTSPASAARTSRSSIDWYSYDRHVAHTASLLEELDLRDATIVVHDWGGPIGLRLAVEHPSGSTRIVILDTGLFTGRQRMTDAWLAFRDFVARTEDLPVGLLVRGACKNDPGDEVIAAYDAPFPSIDSKAGARAFPLLIPQTPDAPGAAAGTARAGGAARGPPADADAVGRLRPGAAARGGRELRRLDRPAAPRVIENASHFLQEDQGPLIGRLIAEWLTQS